MRCDTVAIFDFSVEYHFKQAIEKQEEEQLNKTHQHGRTCITTKFAMFIIHDLLLIEKI